MLHPVARNLRHVIGDEGVGAEIERGRAAEHLVVLGDDRLGHADEAIDVGGVVLAVDREAEGVILAVGAGHLPLRSEEHTSELQSLMRISYAVFCLKKKTKTTATTYKNKTPTQNTTNKPQKLTNNYNNQ